MHATRGDGRRKRGGLVFGLILIGLGVCFLLMSYGVLPDDILHEWWAGFVILAGLGSILAARSPKALGSGVSTLGIGCWLLVASNDWYGLGWSRSWPLALIAAGLGSITRALAELVWREKEERDAI